MHAKKALIRVYIFLQLPIFLSQKVWPAKSFAYTQITPKLVKKAQFCQSITKTPGFNKLNFKIIKLL